MARIPEILAGALLSAVACAPVNEAPKPINQLVAAATVTTPCDPEKLRAVGQEIQVGIKQIWRLIRKPVGYLAAGCSSLALACATQPTPEQVQKPQEPQLPKDTIVLQVTNTPEPATPTATATTTPKPEPTNTPEPALKLADNDVYEGLENKVSVIYMAVPDNTVVFQVRRDDIFCSDGKTRPLAWLVKFPRATSGFEHQRRVQNSLTQMAIGNITGPDTMLVKVGNEQYNTPSPDGRGGQITCPANSFELTTRKIGAGEGVLKKGLARVLDLPALPPQIEAVIDRQIGK